MPLTLKDAEGVLLAGQSPVKKGKKRLRPILNYLRAGLVAHQHKTALPLARIPSLKKLCVARIVRGQFESTGDTMITERLMPAAMNPCAPLSKGQQLILECLQWYRHLGICFHPLPQKHARNRHPFLELSVTDRRKPGPKRLVIWRRWL